ncbi:MAG: rhodanese-like domain-containing protein [Sulfuricurvum sp.]|jgi:rhodanese-related sulfurtransferase
MANTQNFYLTRVKGLMTKKNLLNAGYYLAIIVVAVYVAYIKGWIFPNYTSISPQAASLMIQQNPTMTVLDVRTPEEFAQGHLQGAVLLPVQVLEENLPQLAPLKGKKIVVYCHSGNRSGVAARVLADEGIIPLNMEGGISAWQAAGLSVVR